MRQKKNICWKRWKWLTLKKIGIALGLKSAIESFQDNNSVKTSEILTAIQKCNDSINKFQDNIKQMAGHSETETALSDVNTKM